MTGGVISTGESFAPLTPVRLGRLGIVNPSCQSSAYNNASEKITTPLVALILQQSRVFSPEAKDEQLRAKKDSRTLRRKRESTAASDLKERLPRRLQRTLDESTEKGASKRLSTLPITEHGFALHKRAFRDALCMSTIWLASVTPSLSLHLWKPMV